MDLITILLALLRWGIPALVGGIAVSLLLTLAYVVYKKVFHGKSPLPKCRRSAWPFCAAGFFWCLDLLP